tara:strand:- start:1029 stop:1448 length:420 start_codon:yes stop_codon:yes gene_type:complete
LSEEKGVVPAEAEPRGLQEVTDALKQMIEVTQQEHDLKRGDQDVKREEIAANERVALASIDAQREYHREHFTRYNAHLIHRYYFLGGVLLIVLLFSAFAIWAGAKDLVMDMAKLVVGVGVGAFGGFHYGKTKNQKSSDS